MSSAPLPVERPVSRYRPLFIGSLLVLVTAWVFADVSNMGFLLWDDDLNVTGNPQLDPPSFSNVARFWTAPYLKLYIPLVYTIWALVAGFTPPGTDPATGAPALDPRYFHLLNLGLHLLAVLVVFRILRRLVPSDWAAAMGALLFGLHPVQVEPVCWVTGLKDVLGGLLMLTAVWTFLLFREAQRESQSRSAALLYALALGTYVLALLSKPAAAAAPLIVAALDHWVLRRSFRATASALAPWALLLVPLVLFTRQAQQVPQWILTPAWTRPIIAGDALGFYLWKLLLPLDLAPDYGRTPQHVLAHGWGYVTWVAPAVLCAAAWVRRKQRPLLLAATGVFVASVLPVSGIMPFLFQGYSTTADRYLYVALLGPALALAWLLERLGTPRTLAVCGGCLALLGALASLQTLYWRTDESLCRHTLRVNPRSMMAHGNLGRALVERGEFEEAVKHLREDARLGPADPERYLILARTLASMNRPSEAISELQKVIQFQPDSIPAHNNLGVLFLRTGRYAEAAAQFRAVLRRDPVQAIARENLQLAEERLVRERRQDTRQ
jgi:protein O-mannosyl-transferase